MLEENRENISHDGKRKIESLTSKQSSAAASTAKSDRRPVTPTYLPPKSMLNHPTFGRELSFYMKSKNADKSTLSTKKFASASTPITRELSHYMKSKMAENSLATSPTINDSRNSTPQNDPRVAYPPNSNSDDSIPADPSSPLTTRSESSSSSSPLQQPLSSKRSVGFSPVTSTNSNAWNRMKSPPPPQRDEQEEEDDEEESEEEIHISRPRDYSHYERYSASFRAKSPTPPPPNNVRQTCDDEHLLDSDVEDPPSNYTAEIESQSLDETEMTPESPANADENIYESEDPPSNYTLELESQNEAEMTPENPPNAEETFYESDEDIRVLQPRNLDRYYQRQNEGEPSTADSPSSSNISLQPAGNLQQPTAPRRSMLDDISDDEDDISPDPKRQRRIQFDEETAADNEHHPRPAVYHNRITVASALQSHNTIDDEDKVNMEGPNPSDCLIALPNQRGPCRRPAYQVLEKWVPQAEYDDLIKYAFDSFRNTLHVKTSPHHLFICDSMLSGIPFEKTYFNIRYVDCAHPNNPFKITEFLEEEVKAKRNNYIMKNVFICIGLDMIAHDYDEKRARKNTITFFTEFLDNIINAFDSKGPPRYKVYYNKETNQQFLNKEALLDISPPKLIFITIPQVQSSQPSVKNLNYDIAQMNKAIQKFVKDKKGWAETKGVFMKVYDFEAACAKYNQCDEKDLGKRNGILMEHLSKEYALLMK